MTATYLGRIVAAHRAAAARDDRPLGPLIGEAAALPPTRGFTAAVVADGLGVIAEIKRRSPSKGDLNVALGHREVLEEDWPRGGGTRRRQVVRRPAEEL